MKFKAPIIAMAVLVGLPTAALAQPEGWYMGLGAGLNLQRDADVTGSGINSTVDFDTGALGAATLGYKFGAPRLELEFSYRGNNVDSIDGANGSGRTRTQALMTNLLYDFDLGGFTPYVGVGIGGAAVKYKNVGPFGAASLNDSDLVFAYQGIAGVGYQVTEQLGLFADYRYFATRDAGLTTSGGAGVDAEYAGFANGTSGSAFEIDDYGGKGANCHPGCAVVPGAFGIGEEIWREADAVAAAAGMPTYGGTLWEGGIALAAAAHLIAATPNIRLGCEFYMPRYVLARDITAEPFPYEGGSVRVPEGPGLGVTLDEDALEADLVAARG